MKKQTLVAVIAVALLAVCALPAYINFYLSPAFSRFIMNAVEKEAVRVARHLASVFVPNGRAIEKGHLPDDFHSLAMRSLDQFLLKKIKMFSADGEIIYSTDRADEGQINKNSYFHDVVAAGSNFTKIVKKNSQSLEGRIMASHVVETYVPIMQRGKFVGAFEIYYDISVQKEELDKMVRGLFITSLVLMGLLLLLLYISGRKALDYFNAQQRTARELQDTHDSIEERVRQRTEELEKALTEVKSLRGLLHVCSSCRKVQSEDGRWKELCQYIATHTDAECASDLCPECEKRMQLGSAMSREGGEDADRTID